MRILVALSVAAMVAVSVALAAAPQTSALHAQIDGIFSAWDRKDSPGCALGVFRDGAIAYQRGYGMASLEHDVPITAASVFYAGSVSKQFTAMAAALAMRRGKLSYDDSIRRYLPELPAYADAIKVSHLLHHTSGLRDYNTLLSMAGKRDDDAWDNLAVLRITARQAALNFAPGAEYMYSNTGYTLLATIVERATGEKFAAFAAANIFTPLGMQSSHFHVDAMRLVRHRALAYGGTAGQWTLDTPINQRAGAGGLYTSIADLQKWDENFYTGRVGSAEVLKRMQTPGRLNDGKTLAYAWGLQVGEYRGLPVVEHSGSLGGYRAHILRFPAQHTSVALLCNGSAIAPTTLARRVADVAIAERFTAPVPGPPPGVAGSIPGPVADQRAAAAKRDYAGEYYSAELDAIFTISASDDDVRLQRVTDASPEVLRMEGPADEFRGAGLTIRFQRDAARKVSGLTVDSGRVRGITFVRR
ncbi:MAG: serine hydrolase domain-containing protein [Vicinamibacterales bacterium]